MFMYLDQLPIVPATILPVRIDCVSSSLPLTPISLLFLFLSLSFFFPARTEHIAFIRSSTQTYRTWLLNQLFLSETFLMLAKSGMNVVH